MDSDVEVRRFRLREPVDVFGKPMISACADFEGRWHVEVVPSDGVKFDGRTRLLNGGDSFEAALAVARHEAEGERMQRSTADRTVIALVSWPGPLSSPPVPLSKR